MTTKLKLNLFCIFCTLILVLSYNDSFSKILDEPSIKAGKARITGTVTGPTKANSDSTYVFLFASLPISGEQVQYKVLADRFGKFSVDINVETDISLIV